MSLMNRRPLRNEDVERTAVESPGERSRRPDRAEAWMLMLIAACLFPPWTLPGRGSSAWRALVPSGRLSREQAEKANASINYHGSARPELATVTAQAMSRARMKCPSLVHEVVERRDL